MKGGNIGLYGFLVGGMYDDFARADDVHVHLHAHLKKEELGVGLQTIDFQDIRVVGIIHAHPEVRVHARGELAQHHRMLGNTHDGEDALALKAVLVHLGILRVLDLLVRDVLVVGVPRVPADDEDQRAVQANQNRRTSHGVS